MTEDGLSPDDRIILGLRQRIAALEADLAHARHSANKSLAAWYLAAKPEKRALAAPLWERSAPQCEDPASDGWEAGMEVPT